MFRSPYARSAFLFFAAIAAIVALWTVLPARLFTTDSGDYDSLYGPVATAILEGRGPTLNGAPSPIPPGYPLLVAAARVITRPLGVSENGANLGLNLVSIAASSVFLYEIAALLFGPLSSLMAYALWISYPFLLAISRDRLTEAPFCALLYAALFLVLRFVWAGKRRRGQALVAGALVGFAMLVRPIAIGIPVLLVLVLAFAKRAGDLRTRLRFIGGFVAGCLLLVIPWETWFFVRAGERVPLAKNGAPMMVEGLIYAVRPAPKGVVQVSVPPDVERVQLDVLKNSARLRSASDVLALLCEEWRKSPWAVTKLLLIRAARSWYATFSRRLDQYILLIQAAYLLAALAGILLAASDRKLLLNLVPVAAVIGYFWAMTTESLSILRYMLPAMGLVFILTAAGVESVLRKRIRNRREGSAVALTTSA